MEHTEFVPFKVYKMPCCGHLLCWINTRPPNYCPECGGRVFPEIRNPNHWLVNDPNARLIHESGIKVGHLKKKRVT